MNEKNIAALKTRLVQLGFEPSVETMLRCHICFQPVAFDLVLSRNIGTDYCQFAVHVELANSEYVIPFYIASLRKQVILPADLDGLKSAMEGIDWNLLVRGKCAPGEFDNESAKTAFDVLKKMAEIGPATDILKFKYWVGTSVESMIPNLSMFKAEWEISERFFFFDQASVISFDDACKFLCSRWVEKQLASKKRLLLKRTVGDGGSASRGGSVSRGKLLTKNPRRIERRGPNKSVS